MSIVADKKEKRYVSDNARLMAEWNWEKNNALGLDPKKLTFGSGKKAWWKCVYNHEWQSRIADKVKGDGCPYCSGRYAIKGINDLKTVNPILSQEWNSQKNGNIRPEDFTANSHKKVWWKCSKGHEWQASIKSRNNGSGCPYCSGFYAIQGENDLQTANPTLACEWNYEKNGNLNPFSFTANSGKKVWWKCNKGHEWQAAIYSRNNGNGCPVCHSERNTSFPEYALLFYLTKCGFQAIHSYKEKGYELDIYIPSKRIAIEYDGYFWHKNKTPEDILKNQRCQKDGIMLYRIREGLSSLNDTSIDYIIQRNQKDLPSVIELLFTNALGIELDVDLARDAIDIESLREYTEKTTSILFSHPEIAAEWDYERNSNLKPEFFVQSSHKKVWWKCNDGHVWQSTIDNRTKGYGCPYCSGRSAIIGVNDIATINPKLAEEWNFEKNFELTPNLFKSNSAKKVWWKCSQGHEWQASIASRTQRNGCPYCSGKKVLKGYNDLKTLNPALAEEWNFQKNGNLTPDDVTIHSAKNVWWICDNGHEWQAIIENRTKGNGCPYCSGRKVQKGYNDLLTVNPELAKEWNFEKNGDLTPQDVTAHSNRKVWWKCADGHEWQTKINHRSNGSGCPYCAGQKVLPGVNDLQTVNPSLAKEWNYEKNDGLTPADVMPSSHKTVYWKCGRGHEYQMTVNDRNRGRMCPECAKSKRKASKNPE